MMKIILLNFFSVNSDFKRWSLKGKISKRTSFLTLLFLFYFFYCSCHGIICENYATTIPKFYYLRMPTAKVTIFLKLNSYQVLNVLLLAFEEPFQGSQFFVFFSFTILLASAS